MKKLLVSILLLTFTMACGTGVDLSAPRVIVTSVEGTDPVNISGRFDEASGIGGFIVNGQGANIQGNSFFTTVAAADIYTFTATDTLGLSSTTEIIRLGVVFEDSINARINSSGIDFIAEQLKVLLASIDLVALLVAEGPYDGGNISIEDGSFGSLSVALAPTESNSTAEGKLDVTLDMPTIWINAEYSVPILPDATIDMWADNIYVSGQARAYLDNEGNLQIAIDNISTSINNFRYDIDYFGLGEIIELFVSDVEGTVRSAVKDAVAGYTSDLLSGFLAGSYFDLSVGDFAISASPNSIATDNQSLSLTLDTGVAANPRADVPLALGSSYVAEPLPNIGVTSPGGLNFDIGLMVSSNILNQALLVAYETETTNIELILSGESLSVIDPQDEISDDDEVRVTITPSAPGYVQMGTSVSALAAIGLDGFQFDLARKSVGQDDFVPQFSAVVDMKVPLNIGISESNHIDVSISEVPEIQIISLANQSQNSLGTKIANALVDWLAPDAFTALTDSIELIPVPSFEGYSIYIKELWGAGNNQVHLGAVGDLITVAATAAAEAPSTIVSENSVMREMTVDGQVIEKGQFQFNLSGDNPTGQPLQYRYRVDGGRWSNWSNQTGVTLHRLLSGAHFVEACSRTHLMKVDEDCATLHFSIP